ncbi:DNA topoisomerase IV subunit B [Azospirillum thiophilum]|uniref:DNA topoisomerase 4 subunit B n=1 Tax=Azospirillum thiophilum TaxID=528244 RepID=A0AAC8VXR1_9PROT|nr:DNA topoisomerase IV subunit B [Azospirillum thiophilum]ALG71442.1 DNA topoisomerase IV [Azospirillum thiophilum]KJR64909.1 DNA topoisomerase IV subunit B [Azospirillum thiophilum]
MSDLFENAAPKADSYSAQDIEVLEGLEPVRRRPGMYIGGTDDRALHHLVAEVLDNAMDEAVAGHASRIDLELAVDGSVVVRDNGRGIPIDDHPKYPGKSALEVIMTTLHSGGKFSNKVYQTSGGLHGVGLSVVNALSDRLTVEIAREKQLYVQDYSRGLPQGPLARKGNVKRRGTTIRFHADPEIFGETAHFEPHRLYRLARSKAYLYRGVEIRWSCDPALLSVDATTPASETLHFPGGLQDYLTAALKDRKTLTPSPFAGSLDFPNGQGRVEWAVAWPDDDEGFSHTYCNTVPTPLGGTHEAGLRTALTRGLKAYGELTSNKRAGQVTADDVMGEACILLSVFIREPHFQGQTKEKLVTAEAQRLVEAAVKDHFDHWLSGDPASANALLERLIEKAEERARRKQSKEMTRKSATRRLRLPGKLADCSRNSPEGTELFLVEGDSAGGSAKQARQRETQAILPLRGKILNVASASVDKMKANQELNDLTQALGCGIGKDFSTDKLRYERVIIMTDADVDGAHIASLLMTFFYREMPGLIQEGHLYLALPPLYRLSHGNKQVYARDDAHKDELLSRMFKGKKPDISRFKGLGEMMPAQLRDTTMDPSKRSLLRVVVPNAADPEEKPECERTRSLVEDLMGKRPELRFKFIQDNAKFVKADDIDV